MSLFDRDSIHRLLVLLATTPMTAACAKASPSATTTPTDASTGAAESLVDETQESEAEPAAAEAEPLDGAPPEDAPADGGGEGEADCGSGLP